MIANPKSYSSSLPMAETISRASSSEFKNFKIHIDEYYQEKPELPKIRESARKANLIIFQGHSSDQRLFEQFPSIFDENDLENPDETCPLVNDLDMDDTSLDVVNPDVDSSDKPIVIDTASQDENPRLLLEGNPLIVLQSCTSLDESILSHIVEVGGVGIVGTSSRVHSASGSSFAKCFCDRMLYFDTTVGEAVRDAKNFLLCVERMKTSRGHLQHAKTNRVAVSFRLWGDPE